MLSPYTKIKNIFWYFLYSSISRDLLRLQEQSPNYNNKSFKKTKKLYWANTNILMLTVYICSA